jgi:hypothetical protein
MGGRLRIGAPTSVIELLDVPLIESPVIKEPDPTSVISAPAPTDHIDRLLKLGDKRDALQDLSTPANGRSDFLGTQLIATTSTLLYVTGSP